MNSKYIANATDQKLAQRLLANSIALHQLQRIPELDRRLSNVAIHPDSGLVAVSRHEDYSLPSAEWVGDDRIYLIDAETREVTTLPETREQRVSTMYWDKAGDYLYLQFRIPDAKIRLDPATGERVSVEEIPETYRWRRHRFECPARGQRLVNDDMGIYVVEEASEEREQIVFIEERERGFHDYFATISGMHFSDSCDYVFFVFRNGLYVVDVETHLIASLVEDDVQSVILLQDPVAEHSEGHLITP